MDFIDIASKFTGLLLVVMAIAGVIGMRMERQGKDGLGFFFKVVIWILITLVVLLGVLLIVF